VTYRGERAAVKIGNIPPLGGRVFLILRHDQLPFTWLRALHKGAVLIVKFAQDTGSLGLVYHAFTLPPPAGIAGSVFACADVGYVAIDEASHARRSLGLYIFFP
jgi:hypothetical protein